jgi:hypothetical protein
VKEREKKYVWKFKNMKIKEGRRNEIGYVWGENE